MENLTLTYFVRSWERHSGIMGPGIGLWRREYRETCRASELEEEARVVDIKGSWYRLEGHIHGVCSQKEKGEALSYVIFTLSPITLGNVSSYYVQPLMLLPQPSSAAPFSTCYTCICCIVVAIASAIYDLVSASNSSLHIFCLLHDNYHWSLRSIIASR